MKTIHIIASGILFYSSIIIAEDYTPQQKQELGQKALHEMLQKIFSESMKAKRAFLEEQVREDVISNFATTAPRSEFIVNADISAELQAGTQSATVFVSTDDQSTWQWAPATLLGTEGYENTWGGTISTNDGNSAYAYLSGVVDSEVLGEDYGTIIVSGSPHNLNGNWPPGSNLYAHMVDEPSGDASSNYDITAVRGTYKGSDAVDGEGNLYTDVERLYMSLTLNGNCCDEGGLFGPWYLYGVGIVNPEAEEAVAYAIGYGDGGFGELTPGLLKLTGDLSTGEIDEIVICNKNGLLNNRLTIIIESLDYEYITLDLDNNGLVLMRGEFDSEDPRMSAIYGECFFEIAPSGYVASHCWEGGGDSIEKKWSVDFDGVPNYLGVYNDNLILLDNENNAVVELNVKSGLENNVFPILWPTSVYDMTNNSIIIKSNKLLYVITI